MHKDISELLAAMGKSDCTELERRLLQELWFVAGELRRHELAIFENDFKADSNALLVHQTRIVVCQGIAKEIVARFPEHIKSVRFMEDVRGAAIKMQLVSGRYNGFGGAEDGWCW